jgi:ABC-2 type transport system permease protein
VRIELSNQLAYKLNFILLIVGPPLVFYAIKLNLWRSIFEARHYAPLMGYTFERMVEYQSYVLVVTLLCQSYVSRTISEDIRFGRISAFLLYPWSFMGYHFGSFSAAQVLNLGTAALVLLIGIGVGVLPSVDPTPFAQGFALCALVSVLWFFVWFILSSTTFWIEESWVLRVLFTIVARFLSGAIIPLDLFPERLRDALWYTPFPYLTFVPTRSFMGDTSPEFSSACLVTGLWALVIGFAARALWQRGLRLYSAAGM